MTADEKYAYEERIAIMEFDGNMTREQAEKLAKLEAEKTEATRQ